jgi:hypothetical protein
MIHADGNVDVARDHALEGEPLLREIVASSERGTVALR